MSDKMINIGASFDSSGIKTGTAEAAKAIQDAGGKLSQVTEDIQTKTAPAFKNLQQAYRQTAKDAQVLAMTQGTSSAAFEDATSKAAEYKRQLLEVDAAINSKAFTGAGSQGIGTMANKFDSLGMSMTQITRELPAFTNSMQTGFMAISNNIPMLVDQINMLKKANMDLAASGMPTKSVLSQLAGALFSWNTALSLGITALTVFGGKIFSFSDGSEKAAESQKKLADSTKKANDEIKNQVELIYKRNEQLRLEIDARKSNLSVDEFVLQKNKLRLKQIDEEIRKVDELNSVNAASFLKGGKVRVVDEKYISRLRDEKKLLEDQNIPLAKSIELKKELDALTSKDKTKNIEIKVPDLKIEKFSKEWESFFDRITGGNRTELKGVKGVFGNVLGNLPEQLKAGQIAIENFVNQTGDKTSQWAVETANALQDFNKAILSTATNAFGQLGTIIGQSLAGADISIGQFFASIADQIGSAMIAIGSAMVGAALAGATAVAPMAYAYLGGGFALKSVAGYLGTKSGGNSTPKASGSYSGTGSVMGGNFSPNNMNVEINSRLLGNDLLLSVQKSNQKQTRVK